MLVPAHPCPRMHLCSGIGRKPVGGLVALEGIEGSGKTLQLKLLSQALNRLSLPICVTHEPGGTRFGSKLRDILLDSNGPSREAKTELLLYLADRYQHLVEVIEPALAQGQIVLCDRYHVATLAYQGYARGIGLPTVKELSRHLGIRMPDLTLILDLNVEQSLARARERNIAEDNQAFGRFEAEGIEFHRRVREGYRLLAIGDPERISLIDASLEPQQILTKLLFSLKDRGIIDGVPELSDL